MIKVHSLTKIFIFAFFMRRLLTEETEQSINNDNHHKIPFGSLNFFLYIIYSSGWIISNLFVCRIDVRSDSWVHFHRSVIFKYENGKWN